MFLFFDLETTGLDPDTDQILEVGAVLVQRTTLEYVFGIDGVTARADPKALEPVVLDMHTKSGLLEAAPVWTVEEADITIANIVRCKSQDCMLAGSSVHFDRAFIRRRMPRLDAVLSHRHLDVSVFDSAAPTRASRPNVLAAGHRAYADAMRSLAMFKQWRELLWSGQ